MEPLYFVWLAVLSLVVASQTSTLRALGRSLDQVRAWIDAVVAQSNGAATAPAPAAASPAASAAPAAASPAPQTFASARGEEHGGRWLAIVGSLAVVAAAAFAVQYAIEQGWLTEGLRMVLGAVVGLALVFGGNALRGRLGWFGDAILGTGLGVLYLTAYSGYVFFEFYGYGFALAATVAVSVLAAVLAVSAKVEAPAALGAAGAFLTAVVLPMTASPAAVAFAFAAAAVSLAAAFGTGWRATQLVALAGSALVFVEFLGWGYDESSQFWFVLSFALAFVALFTVSGFGAALFNRREPSSYDIGVTVAATLIFAPVAISLAADRSDTLDGFLPLFLALAYGAAAFWGYASAAPRLANLASLGLSAAFLATAVSLQLDGALVPILWAAEAALLALIARQTSEEAFGIFSGAMAFLALFAVADVNFPADAEPILNARFASLLAVLVAGWVLAAAARVVSRRPGKENWRGGFAVVAIASHLLALGVTANEVTVAYGPEIDEARDAYYGAQGSYVYTDGYGEYREGDAALERASYQKLRKLESAQMTAIAIVWGLYGAIILVIGFAVASAPSRYAGVGTLLLAAGDVFLIVWELGTGYRIVASLTVGVLLLGGAYLFARYRHRITG